MASPAIIVADERTKLMEVQQSLVGPREFATEGEFRGALEESIEDKPLWFAREMRRMQAEIVGRYFIFLAQTRDYLNGLEGAQEITDRLETNHEEERSIRQELAAAFTFYNLGLWLADVRALIEGSSLSAREYQEAIEGKFANLEINVKLLEEEVGDYYQSKSHWVDSIQMSRPESLPVLLYYEYSWRVGMNAISWVGRGGMRDLQDYNLMELQHVERTALAQDFTRQIGVAYRFVEKMQRTVRNQLRWRQVMEKLWTWYEFFIRSH